MKPSKRTPSKRTRSSVRAENDQPTAAATLTNPSSAKRPRLFRRISSTNLRAVKTTAASPAPGGTVVTSASSFSSSSPKPLQSRDDNQLSLRPTEDATSDNIESALCIISDMHKKYTMELRGQISVVENKVVTLEDNLATMGAEKEGLAKEKEQLRVELKAKEEDYNTAVASHENELTAKGEKVAHLQEVVALLQLEKEEANEHTGDTYDDDGKLTRKVLKWGPNNRYSPRLPFCKGCKKRGCRGPGFAECGKVKYGCAGGCGCKPLGSEKTFWNHVMGSTQQTGCLPYARKFSNHIAACEVKGINNYQTFRLKKNEEDDQEASVKEWLDAS